VGVIKARSPITLLVSYKLRIVRHLMDPVDMVRKRLPKQLKAENPGLLKKTRYIWPKKFRNRSDLKQVRLSDLEKLHVKINRAYPVKDAFESLGTIGIPHGSRNT
jgi:hypothetical protein